MTPKRFLLLILISGLIASARPVRAHGGGTPQLTNVSVGSYGVSAWTYPTMLRTGKIHVTIAVAEPPVAGSQELGAPILNADVQVRVTLADETLLIVEKGATHDQASNKFFYEMDFELQDAGIYQVDILIDGPYGQEQTSFAMEVRSGRVWLWSIVLFIGWVVALLLWQGKRTKTNEMPVRVRPAKIG